MLLVHLFVCFIRVSFCIFSLPIGVGSWLRFVIVALPGLSINVFEDGNIYTYLYVKPTDKQLCLYNSSCNPSGCNGDSYMCLGCVSDGFMSRNRTT